MSAYKVEICGVNTAKLPILKEEEKDALFVRIKQGDIAAREEYINGNLRLVLSIIRRFTGHTDNIDDLFQIGCIGLMKSIDNFDPTMGVKFSTYAVPMIIGEVRRYLRDNNSIRVSRSLRDTAYKAIHAKETLMNRTQEEPTIEEIAAESGLTKEEIVQATKVLVAAGADFVKSSTGFYTGGPCVGATEEVVSLMMDAAKGQATREHFLKLIDMGIDRMGIGYRSTPVVLGLQDA